MVQRLKAERLWLHNALTDHHEWNDAYSSASTIPYGMQYRVNQP
jgi:hypothetical protein